MHLSAFSRWSVFYNVLVLASFSLAKVPGVLESVESIPYTFGSYRDTKTTNWTDVSLVDRADTDVDPRFLTGCLKACGGRTCCKSKKSSKKHTRAPGEPTGFVSDISQYTQAELGEYIKRRTDSDPNMEFVLNSLADIPNNLHINMQLLDGKTAELPFPTSRFKVIESKEFSIGMKSLTGCTLLTVVKDFDVGKEDQKMGIWIGHMWEKPGFVPEVEPDLDDDMNEIPGTESMKLDAQVNDWVYKFIEDGFPLPDTPNLAPQKPGSANPQFQDGIKKHLDALKGASAFIMTPRREVLSDDGKITYQNYAHHISHIGRLKGYLKYMDSSLRINKEFLYKPLRDWDEETLSASFTGRALFEYVPDRMKRRFGRLLMEDGGEDKVGLQEFDFRPSA